MPRKKTQSREQIREAVVAAVLKMNAIDREIVLGTITLLVTTYRDVLTPQEVQDVPGLAGGLAAHAEAMRAPAPRTRTRTRKPRAAAATRVPQPLAAVTGGRRRRGGPRATAATAVDSPAAASLEDAADPPFDTEG